MHLWCYYQPMLLADSSTVIWFIGKINIYIGIYLCSWLSCKTYNLAQDISMISMNVKQVYGEWYDTVSDNEIDRVCILREMIEVREGRAKCDIFNIDDAEFIINDL